MRRELTAEGRVVVRLNPVDREGEMLPDFLYELQGGLGIVVIVDAENSKSRGFINRCELVEALTRTSHTRNEFHIELHGAPRNLKWSIGRLRAGAILLQGNSAHVMAGKTLRWLSERRTRDSAAEGTAGSHGTVTQVFSDFSDPEAQRNDLERDAKPDAAWSSRLISQAD